MKVICKHCGKEITPDLATRHQDYVKAGRCEQYPVVDLLDLMPTPEMSINCPNCGKSMGLRTLNESMGCPCVSVDLLLNIGKDDEYTVIRIEKSQLKGISTDELKEMLSDPDLANTLTSIFASRGLTEPAEVVLATDDYAMKFFQKEGTLVSAIKTDGHVCVHADDVTGLIGEWLDADMSDVPPEAVKLLKEAYDICAKSL